MKGFRGKKELKAEVQDAEKNLGKEMKDKEKVFKDMRNQEGNVRAGNVEKKTMENLFVQNKLDCFGE